MCFRPKLAMVGILAFLGSCARPSEPREILFVRDVEGGLQLWRMAEDGSNTRPFTNDTLRLGPLNDHRLKPVGWRDTESVRSG